MTTPSASTLAAFGLIGTPTPVRGGRGLCYRIANTILKPSDDSTESEFAASLSAALLAGNPTAYRLAVPLPSRRAPTTFVVNDWTASTFLPGAVSLSDFPQLFSAVRAFHADVGTRVTSKPSAIADRAFNRFDEADRVTWDEKPLASVAKLHTDMLTQLQPILTRLRASMRPLAYDDPLLACQLVHMDLLGNVLFDEHKPPGLIDLTFYWRPATYAEAVVVADGLTRLGKNEAWELLDLYLSDENGKRKGERETRVQLLARALHWRYLCFAIDPDLDWIKINLPQADYAGATDIVCGLCAC
ncbi:hypothetical protein OQA88_4234 [Cercophora sp. LCS_1]